MARERSTTEELETVLELLSEVERQQLTSAVAETVPPPLRPPGGGPPNKLFEPVRVDGEDQLGRAVNEDKIAILRKKVRALEDRVQDIREAWSVRDTDLDESRRETAREKQRADRAEENVRKLTSILQTMKSELTGYHGRVQEALQEAARREHDLKQDSDRRLREAQLEAERRVREAEQEGARRVLAMDQDAARREQQAQLDGDRRVAELRDEAERRAHEAARREQQLIQEHTQRERTALQEHTRREQEALRDHQRREQTLTERLQRAEQAVRQAAATRERETAMPPPPPLMTKADVEELARSVDTAGRTVSGILKGRVRGSELADALRDTMNLLRSNHELLTSVLRDME